MSFDEDDSGNLKDLLTKNLEMNGTLGNIQAQLRASIFLTLEEEFKEKNIPLINEKTKQILESSVGKVAIAVIQDFLHCLNLEFSLAVFNPETNALYSPKIENKDLLSDLGLLENTSSKDEDGPILFKLIESIQQSKKINGFDNLVTNKNVPIVDRNLNFQSRSDSTKASLPPIQTSSMKQNNDNVADKSDGTRSISSINGNGDNEVNENNTPSEILKSTKIIDKPKRSAPDEEDDYGDEDFSSVSDPQEDTGNGSEAKKNSDKPEDTDADEISEDILEESLGSILDTNSEVSNKTVDLPTSEVKEMPDYQESL